MMKQLILSITLFIPIFSFASPNSILQDTSILGKILHQNQELIALKLEISNLDSTDKEKIDSVENLIFTIEHEKDSIVNAHQELKKDFDKLEKDYIEILRKYNLLKKEAARREYRELIDKAKEHKLGLKYITFYPPQKKEYLSLGLDFNMWWWLNRALVQRTIYDSLYTGLHKCVLIKLGTNGQILLEYNRRNNSTLSFRLNTQESIENNDAYYTILCNEEEVSFHLIKNQILINNNRHDLIKCTIPIRIYLITTNTESIQNLTNDQDVEKILSDFIRKHPNDSKFILGANIVSELREDKWYSDIIFN